MPQEKVQRPRISTGKNPGKHSTVDAPGLAAATARNQVSVLLSQLVELGFPIEHLDASPVHVTHAGQVLRKTAQAIAAAPPSENEAMERVRSIDRANRKNDPFVVLVDSVGAALIAWGAPDGRVHDAAIERARQAISKIPVAGE